MALFAYYTRYCAILYIVVCNVGYHMVHWVIIIIYYQNLILKIIETIID